MTLDEILQMLYSNEINIWITTFWDGGYDVRIGDTINGFKFQNIVYTSQEAADWFEMSARRFYPQAFAPDVPDRAESNKLIPPAEADAILHKAMMAGIKASFARPTKLNAAMQMLNTELLRLTESKTIYRKWHSIDCAKTGYGLACTCGLDDLNK
jgi:hypothetical protein